MIGEGREHDELVADLKATLAAQRELGPEMDDDLVELVVARVDNDFASQVAARVAPRQPHRPRERSRRAGRPGLPPAGLILVLLLFVGPAIFGTHAHVFPIFALILLMGIFSGHFASHHHRGHRQLQARILSPCVD